VNKKPKQEEERNLTLIFPSSLDVNGKSKEHILEPNIYNRCETLKLLLLDDFLQGEMTLEVNFTTHVIMSWFLEYLRRSFVGLSYEGLIQCILLGDYLGIGGEDLAVLFNELITRTPFRFPMDVIFANNHKNENEYDADYHILKYPDYKVPFIPPGENEPVVIRALPFGLVKKYILSKGQQTFSGLHQFRLYTIHWWDLVTNEMIAMAKRIFTRVSHFNEAMLLEALYCFTELKYNKGYIENTLLQHGSFQGQKLDQQRRKEYSERRKAKKEQAKKEKIQKQVQTKAEINKLIVELGYNPLKEWKPKVSTSNCLRRVISNWIVGNHVPSENEVESEMEKTCLLMMERREFDDMFLIVGKDKFKKWVAML
jgi:hypothetical protein